MRWPALSYGGRLGVTTSYLQGAAFICMDKTAEEGRCFKRKSHARARLRKTIANVPRCLIVMEACAGAHYLSRTLSALGHEVRLIAAQYVRPFVQRNKNDFIDAPGALRSRFAALDAAA